MKAGVGAHLWSFPGLSELGRDMSKGLDSLYLELGTTILDRREKAAQYRIDRQRAHGKRFKLGPRHRRTRPYVIDAAKEFLSKRYDQIHKVVCSRRKGLESVLLSDEATVVAAIMDAFGTSIAGVPTATVSQIVVKIGFKRFCGKNPFSTAKAPNKRKFRTAKAKS